MLEKNLFEFGQVFPQTLYTLTSAPPRPPGDDGVHRGQFQGAGVTGFRDLGISVQGLGFRGLLASYTLTQSDPPPRARKRTSRLGPTNDSKEFV